MYAGASSRRASAESVSVSGASPLVEVSSSSVGGVVDVQNIESLPLNGRQFANLALTIPGVGLGFHSDPTKSTQFSPQIAGGNGRTRYVDVEAVRLEPPPGSLGPGARLREVWERYGRPVAVTEAHHGCPDMAECTRWLAQVWHEAAALRTPLVLVPGTIPETTLLAERLGEQGGARTFDVKRIDPAVMAQAFNAILADADAAETMTERAFALVTGGGGVKAAARLVLDVAAKQRAATAALREGAA